MLYSRLGNIGYWLYELVRPFFFLLNVGSPLCLPFPYCRFIVISDSSDYFFSFVRESEPNSWEDTMKDELDRGKYPRMPWHDVQCALWGPPCRDIARHFVQRWNYAKVRILVVDVIWVESFLRSFILT